MRPYLVVAVVGALFASVTPGVADEAEDEAAIRKVMEQAYALANEHDAEGLTALLTEKWEDWGGNRKGRTAWKKYWSELWERQKGARGKLLEEIGIIFVTPDVAIYKAIDETTGMLDAGGKPLPSRKDLNAHVLVKENGAWLLMAVFSRTMGE